MHSAETDGDDQLRARSTRPLPVVAATTGELVLGDEYRTVDVFACGGTREQIDVGGSRFADHIQGSPGRPLRGDVGAQRLFVERNATFGKIHGQGA